MVEHHENFDSYLVLVTDQSAKKTRSRKNVTRMKGHVFEEKVMPRPEEHPWKSYSGVYENTDTSNTKGWST